jgi:hypothetical protein
MELSAWVLHHYERLLPELEYAPMFSLTRPMTIVALLALSAGTAQAGASIRVYTLPQQDGYLLSSCLEANGDCGKPAADAWCQSNGFEGALTFQRERREAITRMLGSGAFCEDRVCETFRQIKCFTPAEGVTAQTAEN